MSIYKSTSRFKITPIITYDNNIMPSMMKKFDFLKNLDEDQILSIAIDGTRAGRPDLIANDLYGTSLYKWVLILFNNVTNPLNWPENGTVIKAPTNDAVWGEL